MQVLIKAVKIKNFRGYGENPYSEDGFYCFDQLDKDFVLISGFNGFGKTSFYEAIEWCLSDSVNRLEKFRDVYNIPDLRKGKYLKFQKANGQSTDDREIVVELQFIEQESHNIITIIRRTNSNMLGVGDYTSKLYMQQGEEAIHEVSLRDIDRMLFGENNITIQPTTEVKEVNRFLFSNIMTQDNLHDFLYTNNLKERQHLFLRLMSRGEGQKISERLKDLTPHSFTNRIKSIQDEIKLKQAIINRVSEKVQVSDTQIYFDQLNMAVQTVHELLVDFLGVGFSLPVTMKSYSDFLEKLKTIQNDTSLRNIEIDKEINHLKLHRTKMIELNQIKQVVDVLQKEAAVNRLISRNLASLNSLIAINSANLQELQQKSKEAGIKKEQYQNVLTTGRLVQQSLENIEESFKGQFEQFIEQIQIHEQNSFNELFIQQLDDKDRELRQNAKQLKGQIQIIDKQFEQQQTLNKHYSDLLQTVSTYITNQTDIDHCPVCHNTTVQNEHITKDRLLRLIDATIAQGSSVSASIIQEKHELQGKLKATYQQIDELVRNPIRDYINTTHNKFKQLFNNAETDISQFNQQMEDIREKLKNQQLEYQQFEADIKLLGVASNFTEATIQKLQSTIRSSVLAVRSQLPESLHYAQLTELRQQYQSIKEGLTNDLSVQKTTELIQKQSQKLQQGQKIIMNLQEIVGWILQGGDLKILQQQHQHEQELLQLKAKVEQISRLKKDYEQLRTNLAEQEQVFIQKQLKDHPIITWIYKLINPHPFYNKLEIINEKGGLSFKNEGKEINLDQIFSAAQSNILVLSIFLGLGMTHHYSSLGQLFLDDPIQSMDDVNILGFIDLLRAILDSQSEQNNLVISTHDSNFAKLLGIKMRNRSFIEYQIVAYGEEGPLIKVNVH